jgi:hypothetical protein
MSLNDSEEVADAALTPRDVMRERHPDLFSDTVRETTLKLPTAMFEYHLDTLTSRKQEYEFEYFCRKLAEKELCPNLRVQTGPTGGGDSKVDTETYPVAAEIAERWWVGEPSAASQRWAFAFSAKKDWKSKVKSDVKNIMSSGRAYDLIYFISNQFISDKKQAATEKELSDLAQTPVRVIDRSWIVEKVYANGHLAMAIDALGIGGGGVDTTQKPGPLDIARLTELEELDRQIADPAHYVGADYQLAEDSLQAALLARGLERPRSEIDGRFSQAERLARKLDYSQQRMRIAYNRAWTAYWWFGDFEEFVKYYGEVEVFLGDSTRASDVESLVTLWQLLVTSAHRGQVDPKTVDLFGRDQALDKRLSEIAADSSRPNNAMQARTDLWLMRATRAFHLQDAEQLERAWRELSKIVADSARFGAYPVERLANIVGELGKGIDSPTFDALYEEVVDAIRARRSEGEAGQAYAERGLQKLKHDKPYEAIKWFGRAEGLLIKEEYRGELNMALAGGSIAYEQAGLLWAARNKILVAAERSFAPFLEKGEMILPALRCAQRLVWLELQLGRIPNILSAMRLAAFSASYLKLTEKQKQALAIEQQSQEALLGLHMLNLPHEELRHVVILPDAFERMGLTNARLALLYALGQDQAITDEGYFSPEEDSAATRRSFELWHDLEVNKDIADRAILVAGDQSFLRSVILGAEFVVQTPNHIVAIGIAESILGSLEALMATSDEGDVLPHRESTPIIVHLVDPPATSVAMKYDLPTGEFHIDCPRDLRFENDGQIIAHNEWLRDTIVNLALRTFTIRDSDKWMNRVIKDEDGLTRSLALGDMLTLARNVFGDAPDHLLADWITDADKPYEVLRPSHWRGEKAPGEKEFHRPSRRKSGPPPEGFLDTSTQKHTQRTLLSPIDIGLWNQAEWGGTLFGWDYENPPFLGVGFKDIEAGLAIFRRWRERFGIEDAGDDLRVTVITGVSKSNPTHYSVVIGANPDRIPMSSEKTILFVSRINRMTPTTTANLDNFLRVFEQFGAYYLSPAKLGEVELHAELSLIKRHLHVRQAWEIGEQDTDASAIHHDDDPIIPPGVEDAPVLKIIARKAASRRSQ